MTLEILSPILGGTGSWRHMTPSVPWGAGVNTFWSLGGYHRDSRGLLSLLLDISWRYLMNIFHRVCHNSHDAFLGNYGPPKR